MSSQKTIWDEFQDHEFAHAYFDERLNIHIATQLKVLREQREFSQQELARHADMAQERISLMENVNYSSWTINTLRRLAKALGVRLRVSFESFGSGLQEASSFTKESLLRPSLTEELNEHFRPSHAGSTAFKEIFNSAASVNRPRTAESDLVKINLRDNRYFGNLGAANETDIHRPSAGDMAVYPYGSKPTRQGSRAEWHH